MKPKNAAIYFSYFFVFSAFLLATVLGNRTVTAIAENQPLRKQHVIVIDAGHGGVDGGATSCTGKLESCFNLEISLRLRDLLHFLGYETKMIRTEDVSIYTKGETIAQKKISDLKERLRICAETDGAILLSIHQNFFEDNRYSGAQVFYPCSAGSEELAKLLQKNFVSTLNPGSKRNAKKAQGIYLMDHITCPGILIECGFLSNPQEEARLRSDEYQKAVCCVIACTVAEFIE